MMNDGTPPPPDPNAMTQPIPIVSPPPPPSRPPRGGFAAGGPRYGTVRQLSGRYEHRFGNLPAYLLARLAAFVLDIPGVAFVCATFGFNAFDRGYFPLAAHDLAGFDWLALSSLGAALAFSFVAYRIGYNVDLTPQPMQWWLLDYALGALEIALFAGVLVAYVLWLVDRTRVWYVLLIATIFAVAFAGASLGTVFLSPLAPARTPYHGAGAADAAAPVLIASMAKKTRTFSERTAGTGDFTRIVLNDVLVAAASPPEIAFVIAHESAHVRFNDVTKLVAFGALLVVIAAAFGVSISDRIGFRRDDDALSRLALVGCMVGLAALVLFPVYNTYARGIETRAFQALRLDAAGKAAGVRYLVRRADHDLIPLCLRRSTNWYFADDVALGTRIAEVRGSSDPCGVPR